MCGQARVRKHFEPQSGDPGQLGSGNQCQAVSIRILAADQDRAVRKSRQFGPSGGGHLRGDEDGPAPVLQARSSRPSRGLPGPRPPARRRARRRVVFPRTLGLSSSAIPASCLPVGTLEVAGADEPAYRIVALGYEGPGEGHLGLLGLDSLGQAMAGSTAPEGRSESRGPVRRRPGPAFRHLRWRRIGSGGTSPLTSSGFGSACGYRSGARLPRG